MKKRNLVLSAYHKRLSFAIWENQIRHSGDEILEIIRNYEMTIKNIFMAIYFDRFSKEFPEYNKVLEDEMGKDKFYVTVSIEVSRFMDQIKPNAPEKSGNKNPEQTLHMITIAIPEFTISADDGNIVFVSSFSSAISPVTEDLLDFLCDGRFIEIPSEEQIQDLGGYQSIRDFLSQVSDYTGSLKNPVNFIASVMQSESNPSSGSLINRGKNLN